MMFRPSVDGYFLTESPEQVFTRGGQTQVPLLLGSNELEMPAAQAPAPTKQLKTLRENFVQFRNQIDVRLAHYPGAENVKQSTWRWMDLHRQTGQAPIFYYRYVQGLPPEIKNPLATPTDTVQPPVLGAAQDAQVAYAFGNLGNQPRYAWRASDYDVSRIFSRYMEQFVKTGDPNGANQAGSDSPDGAAAPRNTASVPNWPAVRVESQGVLRQVIGENTQSVWDRNEPSANLEQPVAPEAPAAG